MGPTKAESFSERRKWTAWKGSVGMCARASPVCVSCTFSFGSRAASALRAGVGSVFFPCAACERLEGGSGIDNYARKIWLGACQTNFSKSDWMKSGFLGSEGFGRSLTAPTASKNSPRQRKLCHAPMRIEKTEFCSSRWLCCLVFLYIHIILMVVRLIESWVRWLGWIIYIPTMLRCDSIQFNQMNQNRKIQDDSAPPAMHKRSFRRGVLLERRLHWPGTGLQSRLGQIP